MIIGITYGTFDLLHYGHLRLLQNIKGQCDYLIVGVSTDEFNELKGKKTFIPFIERALLVDALSIVDAVIPEDCWEQKRSDVKNFKVDKFFMGSDWKGEFDELQCEVIYLPRTPDISTTEIKKRLYNDMKDA